MWRDPPCCGSRGKLGQWWSQRPLSRDPALCTSLPPSRSQPSSASARSLGVYDGKKPLRSLFLHFSGPTERLSQPCQRAFPLKPQWTRSWNRHSTWVLLVLRQVFELIRRFYYTSDSPLYFVRDTCGGQRSLLYWHPFYSTWESRPSWGASARETLILSYLIL